MCVIRRVSEICDTVLYCIVCHTCVLLLLLL